MIVRRREYIRVSRGHLGGEETILIDRPEDVQDPSWMFLFRQLAFSVFRQALHDLVRGAPAHRRLALAFLTATPGTPDWPLFEHWWTYVASTLGSLHRFRLRCQWMAEHPESLSHAFQAASHRRSTGPAESE